MSTSDEDLTQLAAATLEALNRGDEDLAENLGKLHEKMLKARDEDKK